MSTASYVPATIDLEFDDVDDIMEQTSTWDLIRDSFLRFRKADGFSFARSLAFQVTVAAIPAIITVVGIAAITGESRFQQTLREAITSLAPGPASDIFLTAFRQGTDAGAGDVAAIAIGGVAALVAAVTAMAQLQRGATRIYGVDTDRPSMRRYGVATILTLTVGIMIVAAFLGIVVGGSVIDVFSNDGGLWWGIARWAGAILLLGTGMAIVFKVAPNRRQPGFSWLMFGGGLAVVLWLVVSVLLTLYLNASSSFGDTYGPLAGFVGLLLWTQLSSIAVLFGLSVAAQLEAIRAGVPSPVSETDRSVSELSWAG
jgi:YihY family inner membrane protein